MVTAALEISYCCRIDSKNAYVEAFPMFMENNKLDFDQFSKSIYKKFELNYPKFFKMDNLSKLALLAAEAALNTKPKSKNTAIVLTNRASSLDTDRKHQESIQDKDSFYPSPSVFVYTLPNIAIGEISIKHGLQSENAFAVFDDFNAGFLYNYSKSLIQNNKADAVICGWVDFDGDDYEAFMYQVSDYGNHPHNIEKINELYQMRK